MGSNKRKYHFQNVFILWHFPYTHTHIHEDSAVFRISDLRWVKHTVENRQCCKLIVFGFSVASLHLFGGIKHQLKVVTETMIEANK